MTAATEVPRILTAVKRTIISDTNDRLIDVSFLSFEVLDWGLLGDEEQHLNKQATADSTVQQPSASSSRSLARIIVSADL